LTRRSRASAPATSIAVRWSETSTTVACSLPTARSDAVATAGDQGEPERAPEGDAPVARGDVPEHAGGHRRVAGLDELRALGQQVLVVERQQADQVLAVLTERVGPVVRPLADEVGLLLGHDPAHAEVLRHDRPVGVLADDRVALLGAQDVHGLGAVRGDAVGGTGLVQGLPESEGLPR
jgi:hypothetical protein